MFFPSLGVHEMEGFLPQVETIPDERAKDAVLLVGALKNAQI